MKNIFLIPTEKPSKLFIEFGDLLSLDNEAYGVNNQHIYITNDEEIKDGEYGVCLSLVRQGFKSYHAVFKMNSEQRNAMEALGGQKKAEVLKVILTTDQDLIKDGVQEISDEFLEWFVNNPSCEFIDWDYKSNEFIQKEIGTWGHDEGLLQSEYDKYVKEYGAYEIIIPKDEPKQETPEDAAEKWVFETNGHKWSNNDNTTGDNYGSFIAGAEWQEQRMYSGEEVKKLATDFFYHWYNSPGNNTEEGFDKWFEQFKKK